VITLLGSKAADDGASRNIDVASAESDPGGGGQASGIRRITGDGASSVVILMTG